MKPADAVAHLRERADAQFDQSAALALRYSADVIEAALREADDATVTLRQAAVISGYSEDHLGRLMRDGKLTNRGRSHRPLIRRADLPIKPGLASLRKEDAGGHFSDRSAVVASVIPRRAS